MVEEAIGKGAADAFVKEREHQRHLDLFFCEAIAVAMALDQLVSLEFSEVIAQLGAGIGGGGEVK